MDLLKIYPLSTVIENVHCQKYQVDNSIASNRNNPACEVTRAMSLTGLHPSHTPQHIFTLHPTFILSFSDAP